ncbi:MAG: type-F conjugative transfer system protein TraW [Holosporaceae bacterium]|jgi:conjugal transfer pilus assembly protein TraW|nr:type-F conjugative transfer system protein TraW [Holosporaceae bacterium]
MIGLRQLLILGLFLCPKVTAKNFVVWEETFSINEPDFMKQIYAKLGELQEKGKLEAARREIEKRIIRTLENPQPVQGIIHTETPRTFEFDPTVQVTRDLKDHNGRIFAKKGEYFNPLDRVKMTKAILFIDGDDDSHIKWAFSKQKEHALCLILVNGSPLKLQKHFNQSVYFDQYGILVSKLGIKQVPAMALQRRDEKVLTVTEEIP